MPASYGAEERDGPAALLTHVGQEGPGGVEEAEDVGVEEGEGFFGAVGWLLAYNLIERSKE